MLRDYFNKIRRRSGLISQNDYQKRLQRYRNEHPESLEEERKQEQQWIASVAQPTRNEQEESRIRPRYPEEATLAKAFEAFEAFYELRETARAAFMSHPAATESDFRRCWPGIREELLKQHALEELTLNPALSERLVMQTSEAKVKRDAKSDHPTLQVLKAGRHLK